MPNPSSAEWRKLPVSLTELCIDTSLRCGQSFRWRKSASNEWSCALQGRLLTLRQDDTHIHYRAILPLSKQTKHGKNAMPTPPPSSPTFVASNPNHDLSRPGTPGSTEKLVRDYLNLRHDLTSLYSYWSSQDPNFRKRVANDMDRLQGIRILQQDPWEALCGFICSSNNNIKRISLMMNRLCAHYGRFIAELEEEVIDLEGEDSDAENVPPKLAEDIKVKIEEDEAPKKSRTKKIKVPYHDFPPPEALTAPDTEQTLRNLGFGYRAKYIYQTACVVANEKGGVKWLETLMNTMPDVSTEKPPPGGREGYRNAHSELLQLTGVGPKVADCVCLMGLGWREAVPVDTHVWQIAVRDYRFGGKGGKNATMTKALYDAVGDKFRELWGLEAGWAHSVLFTADLRDFKERVVKVEIKEENASGNIVKKVAADGLTAEAAKSTRKPNKRQRMREANEIVKKEVVLEKAIKPEWEEEERKVLEVHDQDMMSRIKRRRRGAT